MDIRHPGQHLREYIVERGWNQTELAKRLKMMRPHVNRVLNGRTNIEAPLAVKLERVTGIDARVWLTEQLEYNLARARKS